MSRYQNRASRSSVSSTASSSTASTVPSWRSSRSSFSSVQPSPFEMVPSVCPDIMEDEDEEPMISIGPEQIDENPFDPSLSDEEYYKIMRARQATQSPKSPSESGPGLLARLVSHGSKFKNAGSRNGAPSWRSRFKRRGTDELEQPASRPTATTKRQQVPEPGVVLSCNNNHSARWGLVPLDAAQERNDIIRRPEGFEMAEQR